MWVPAFFPLRYVYIAVHLAFFCFLMILVIYFIVFGLFVYVSITCLPMPSSFLHFAFRKEFCSSLSFTFLLRMYACSFGVLVGYQGQFPLPLPLRLSVANTFPSTFPSISLYRCHDHETPTIICIPQEIEYHKFEQDCFGVDSIRCDDCDSESVDDPSE